MAQVFISYVEEDGDIVAALASAFEGAGMAAWYYQRDSLPGVSYLRQIAVAIEKCQALVVVISNSAIGSEQMTNEIVRAFELKRSIVPLLRGLSHADFQKLQPDWRGAIGAATSIQIPPEGIRGIVPRLLDGLAKLPGFSSAAQNPEAPASAIDRSGTANPLDSAHSVPPPHVESVASFDRTNHPQDDNRLARGPTIHAVPGITVHVPSFHCGSIVPLNFFIDRESELEEAQKLIASRQSFLIVGRRRAGKTSFGQKLIDTVMATRPPDGALSIGSTLDLQQYSILDVNGFLEHTLLHMIGDIARHAFSSKYFTLNRKDPYAVQPELRGDLAFKSLLELYREVVKRTHVQGTTKPSGLRPDEFERLVIDLLDILRLKGWSNYFIFFDEANRLPLDLSVEFLTWNVEALNRAGVVSIYAASPEMAEKFNLWSDSEIRIGPFPKLEDMRRLLTRYYFGDSGAKESLPATNEAIFKIWELSQGIPYLIQHLSGRSFAFANREVAELVDERHVRSAHEELSRKKPKLFNE
jgi:TIR domain